MGLTDTSETQNSSKKMMKTMWFVGLALLVGVTNMKHFILETKGEQTGSDYTNSFNYANDDDWVPFSERTWKYTAKCANGRYYTCPERPDPYQCKKEKKECNNCKGCKLCLDVSCLKKFACKKSGMGKEEKLCSMIGEYSGYADMETMEEREREM